MKIMLTLAAGLAFGGVAMAQVTGATGGAASQIDTGQREAATGRCERGSTVDGDRCLCRRIEVESSSRMSLRTVCMTAKQWKQFERER